MSAATLSPSTHYRYAAARLASDHAALRLENALAAFVDSLQEPGDAHTPLAKALSTQLALLRQGTPTAPSLSEAQGPADRAHLRRAA